MVWSRATMIAAALLIVQLVSMGERLPAQEPKGAGEPEAAPASPSKAVTLAMSRAVACRSIEGYQQYEVLPEGALTAEEKLQVYYEPLNFKSILKDGQYVVHLTQDGQIRRKGEKAVLRKKRNILDYDDTSRAELGWIFLRNSVPLKGLTPGEYEYDIILRDEHAPGPAVTQSLKFRIIPPAAIPKP